MSKVDLEFMQKLLAIERAAMEMAMMALDARTKEWPFCNSCGERNPPDGFYPLGCSVWELSCTICNECEREGRR